MNQAAPYRSGEASLDPRGADEARPDSATPLQPAPPATVDRLTELIRLAQGHEEAGRLNEAEEALCRALALAPEHAAALHLLGVVGFRRSRIDEAAALMERALAASPETALYHRNICEVYRSLGRYDDALAAAHRAVRLTPRDPHCYHNLGVLHYHRLELDEAIHCAQSALALDAEFAGAHFGIAEAALLRGDFLRGWEEYEWRFRLANAPQLLPPTDRPQWDGAPLPNGRLLLIADQGYGDVIQFARYIPWAARRCANIAVACSSEIRPVVSQQTGIATTFDHWENQPDFLSYCALSSLPRLAGTTLQTIPAPIPYLRADPGKVTAWADRLSGLVPAGYHRLGIAWAGRPTHVNDRNRSTTLATLAPLGEVPRVALISLQKGSAQAQIGAYWGRAPLVNLGPEIVDFADTMAILEELDLIVTIDTAVGHLAGAMGRPVWLMLPFAPDWRWLLDRADSPWYPTARLFRQRVPGQWGSVIAEVVNSLAASPLFH
jgi:tetratricopeptide (TPR) repeat protein